MALGTMVPARVFHTHDLRAIRSLDFGHRFVCRGGGAIWVT